MARLILFPILVTLALPACTSTPSAHTSTRAPLQTVPSVNLARYQGKWFELARYPQWFQRDCVSAMAEYSRNADGSIRVLNTCIKADGSQRSVTGSATPVDAANNRLKVRFTQHWLGRLIPVPEEGNYWIIYLSEDYRQAVVGTPDRKALWFLSRSPHISEKTFNHMEAIATKQGFNTKQLIIDKHTLLER